MTNKIVSGLALTAVALLPASALAHPHTVNGHEIANGQLHPMFENGVSCDDQDSETDADPAWYGLETAHHGPDAGDPGRDDYCYGKGYGGNQGFDN